MALWFDAKDALAAIEGSGARAVAPSPGAIRAIRANPPAADPPPSARIARPNPAAPPSAPRANPQEDAAALADALRLHGPMTRGAAAFKNALRIGRQDEIRDRTTEGLHVRMAGLNLLAAIIIYRNTKHLGKAVVGRGRAGLHWIVHPNFSPLGWAHFLLTGEYRWPKK